MSNPAKARSLPDRKVCTKCGEDKALSDFYSDRRTADGRRPHCKACHNARVAEYRAADPEKRRERDKAWRHANPERVREHNRTYAARNTPAVRERIKNWREDNPEKARAHYAVRKALDSGRLIRPKACEQCGEVYEAGAGLHAHHEDYAKRLDVIWLCSRCHRERHVGGDDV